MMNELLKNLKHELLTCRSVTDEMKNQVHELIVNEEINWYPEVEELHKIYLFACYRGVFTGEQLEIIYEKAYRDYHSCGLEDIECEFFELVDLVSKVINSKHIVNW